THDGRNELDAAIMDGKKHRAGAVAAVTRIKNPISAARAVLDDGKHVLLVGDGADRFAISNKVEEVSPVYFWTQKRWDELKSDIAKENLHSCVLGFRPKIGDKSKPDIAKKKAKGRRRTRLGRRDSRHFGTVGAVARDKDGNLAAGTSTGGL